MTQLLRQGGKGPFRPPISIDLLNFVMGSFLHDTHIIERSKGDVTAVPSATERLSLDIRREKN